MPRVKTTITKKKPEKRGVMHCGGCGEPGADKVPCGYCKDKNGETTYHYLCNKCFMKGCPFAAAIKKGQIYVPPVLTFTSQLPIIVPREYLVDAAECDE